MISPKANLSLLLLLLLLFFYVFYRLFNSVISVFSPNVFNLNHVITTSHTYVTTDTTIIHIHNYFTLPYIYIARQAALIASPCVADSNDMDYFSSPQFLKSIFIYTYVSA